MMFLDNFADFICASNLVNKISTTVSKVLGSVKKFCIPNFNKSKKQEPAIISKSKHISTTNKKVRAISLYHKGFQSY